MNKFDQFFRLAVKYKKYRRDHITKYYWFFFETVSQSKLKVIRNVTIFNNIHCLLIMLIFSLLCRLLSNRKIISKYWERAGTGACPSKGLCCDRRIILYCRWTNNTAILSGFCLSPNSNTYTRPTTRYSPNPGGVWREGETGLGLTLEGEDEEEVYQIHAGQSHLSFCTL